jgi:hypothetical protein
MDVPASQQVIDVEVDTQPSPSSSSSSSTASNDSAAAAAADPWAQTPTPPEPAAAAVEPDEEDAEALPPALQLLLLLPGTHILKYSVWGVWVASWLTVLPAVAAAVQVGELGRVVSALLLSYPGISPLVTHLAAVSVPELGCMGWAACVHRAHGPSREKRRGRVFCRLRDRGGLS